MIQKMTTAAIWIADRKNMGAAVIAHCDAPPVFEFSEHVFDLVALFI